MPKIANFDRIVTPMPVGLLVWHWTMIVATAGLWWPVYALGKRKRTQVVIRPRAAGAEYVGEAYREAPTRPITRPRPAGAGFSGFDHDGRLSGEPMCVLGYPILGPCEPHGLDVRTAETGVVDQYGHPAIERPLVVRPNSIDCPRCGARAHARVYFIDLALMHEPPAQVERYLRVTRWQCFAVESHNGERSVPADTKD